MGTKRATGWGRVPRDLGKGLVKDTQGRSTVTERQCQKDKETEPQAERKQREEGGYTNRTWEADSPRGGDWVLTGYEGAGGTGWPPGASRLLVATEALDLWRTPPEAEHCGWSFDVPLLSSERTLGEPGLGCRTGGEEPCSHEPVPRQALCDPSSVDIAAHD